MSRLRAEFDRSSFIVDVADSEVYMLTPVLQGGKARMAGKANGHASEEGHFPVHQASLSAIQELIGAIGARDTSVARFILGEYEVFLFAARRRNTGLGELPKTGVGRTTRRTRLQDLSAARNAAAVPLDSIISAACRQLDVSRTGLRSKSRSRPLSLARALIAQHASRSGVASVSQVAAAMKLKNKNSLYVGMARYRKLIPELFTIPLERFIDATLEPSERLRVLLGKKSSRSDARTTTSDVEIGQRIARALPREES
jgi:hypothetical protein